MIGPVEPTGKGISSKGPSKEPLPAPKDFRLPDEIPLEKAKSITTYPSFELLDHAQRVLGNPQATLEVLHQGALPEGEKTQKLLQEETLRFISKTIAKQKDSIP